MAGGRMFVRWRKAVVVAAIGGAALCASLAVGQAGGGTTSLQLKQIGSFHSPVYVYNAPGAKHLLFVVEQPGRIEVLRRGHRVSHPFLRIEDRVVAGGEQGLLSVAFDPNYARNRRFFVYYTNNV